MFTNKYIFIYSTVLILIVATVLSTVSYVLKPLQEGNIRIEKMQNILKAANVTVTVKETEKTYTEYIKDSYVVDVLGKVKDSLNAFTIDMALEIKKAPEDMNLPVYVFTGKDSSTLYILPMRGKGLWGPVWGYISIKDDMNTIAGCVYDHKGETPGLGAEINESFFQVNFVNKTIFNKTAEFAPVRVMKASLGGDRSNVVDAISGGTITSDGVDKMLTDGLSRYVAFLKSKKK